MNEYAISCVEGRKIMCLRIFLVKMIRTHQAFLCIAQMGALLRCVRMASLGQVMVLWILAWDSALLKCGIF